MINLKSIYQSYLNFSSPNRYLVRRFLRSKLKSLSANTCLDIGAGNSPYREIISTQFSVENYMTTDIDGTSSPTFASKAENLPLKNGKIDAVVSFDVIQHVNDYGKMLSETNRVLEKNGLLIISYPFSYGECDKHDFHRWTKEGIETDLRPLGFTILHHETRGGTLLFLMYIVINTIAALIPGTRKKWHSSGSFSDYLRITVISLLTLPFNILGFVCILIDYILPTSSFYIGGILVAKKTDDRPALVIS